MRAALIATVLLAATGAATAGDFELRAGPGRVSLLELYTSEGCSSCPPADAWLSGLLDDRRLWSEVVPVAFHVDYWDYLGWRDRFADPAATARQREHAEALGMRTIYTPGLFLDGEEWRRWFGMRELELDGTDLAGELHAWRDGGRLAVRYRPVAADDGARLVVHVALLGFGLRSDVRRGENSGRELHHDFVVLGRAQAALDREADGTLAAGVPLPTSGEATERRAVAVWVSRADRPAPLQAAGGWYPAAE